MEGLKNYLVTGFITSLILAVAMFMQLINNHHGGGEREKGSNELYWKGVNINSNIIRYNFIYQLVPLVGSPLI